MKNYIGLIVTLLMILLISCSKEVNDDNDNSNNDKPLYASCNDIQTNMLYLGPTQYAVFGDSTGVERLVNDFRDNPLSTSQAGVFGKNANMQVKIGSQLLSPNGGYTISDFTSFYGNLVTFEIGLTNPIYSEIYIPKRIQLLAPAVNSEKELFPLCYFNDMEIRWNADGKNDNGIVVIVEWKGDMYAAPEVPNVHIRNIDILLQDDGVEVLDNDIFNQIPDDAMATITILRGNVDIADYNGTSVKVGGESIMALPFILVRDMSHYN